jgi:hypothetical protein
MTVRGGGVPRETTVFHAVVQNGSAASELRCRCALLHHGFGSLHPPNTRMWHDPSCTTRGLPSMFVVPTTPIVPSCSEPSRTGPCGGANAPSLTAPARAGVSFVRVGTKKRAAKSNKETEV